MDTFQYRNAHLHAEAVALSDIAAQVGTPCYVYSRAHIQERWQAFDAAFGTRAHLICYAVKANSNLAVLNVLAQLGSGFDIVSVGELERVLRAGGDPTKIVFSGVGKTAAEMARALEVGIRCFNVESAAELERLNQVAGERRQRAPVSLRVNPDVDAKTHPYIATGLKENKFGVAMQEAMAVYQRAQALAHIDIVGIDCHIGSQLTELTPFNAALERVIALVNQLAQTGITLKHLDLGGGLGIRYRNEETPTPQAYVQTLLQQLASFGSQHQNLELIIEPGRAIVGNAGVLLTRVEYLKHTPAKNFAIVDAAMNDLMRPALYDAWQDIVPVVRESTRTPQRYDVVGPVCESGDFLGRDRNLGLQAGDLLAIRSAGAYGASMSSQYNSRPRCAEVMVDAEHFHIVRRREALDDLWSHETILPTEQK